MIVLVTDFGLEGPYTGQMKSVLFHLAPSVPVVDLFADAPAHDIKASAYLLNSYSKGFPPGTVFLCVVDPGVGTAQRQPVVVQVDDYWYVGPDNGLFNLVRQNGRQVATRQIVWRPERLSNTFHGRDLFAPLAAWLASGEEVSTKVGDAVPADNDNWPLDYYHVIYIDHFGNAMTGIRGEVLPDQAVLEINESEFPYARTFGDVKPGDGFWYRNANGLVEVAANRRKAAEKYCLYVGATVLAC